MTLPRILVDGDSCPVAVREVLTRGASRGRFTVTYLARVVPSAVTAAPAFDIVAPLDDVDEEIVARARSASESEPTLVITRDIPLAERLVVEGYDVMNDRGHVWGREEIAARRSERDVTLALRRDGLLGAAPPSSYGARERKAFADALDRWCARL